MEDKLKLETLEWVRENHNEYKKEESIKRTKLNKEIEEEYIRIKIPVNKMKKLLAIMLLASIMLTEAKGLYNINQQDQLIQQEIESMIKNDGYLSNLVVYTSDSSPETEIREINHVTGLQDRVDKEKLAEYITQQMDISDEKAEMLMEYYGVELKTNSHTK